MIRMLHIALLVVLPASVGFTQVDAIRTAENADQPKASPLRKLMEDSLMWYELQGTTSASTTVMSPKIVMRWANNTRGSEDGMTVLFIAGGRPEAVCCIYPWEKTLIHEFDSLSRGTLIARHGERMVWQPTAAGVQFNAVPDSESPAETAIIRLRQMKSMAGHFSSTMLGWRANKSDRESLRLLPQPLYRYESQRSDLLDGAVFAFVQGTDPESLLLIEAVKTGESSGWQYAFARRTSGELEGRYKDRVVWHANRFPANNDPKSIHIALSEPLAQNLLQEISGKGEQK